MDNFELLLHMDGKIIDECNNPITLNNVEIDKQNKVFSISSCKFNNVDGYSYVEFENMEHLNFKATDRFTIALWFKCPTQTSAYPILIGTTPNDFGIIVCDTNTNQAFAIASFNYRRIIYANINVCDDKWHHLALVNDSKKLTLYLDGKKIGSCDSVAVNLTNFRLGHCVSSPTNSQFVGNIDEFMICKDVLYTSDFEIPDKPYGSRYVIIKQNNKYYTIKDNSLIEIVDNITQDVFIENSCTLLNVIENIDLLDDNFQLVSLLENPYMVNSIKSASELIVASNNFSSKIAEHIDYFKAVYEKNANSYIKVAFSIDNGVTWKGNNFEDLSVEIPLKPYSDLTEEERTKWNTAKETIATGGIPIEDLETLDFNTLDFEYIRFAYVLSITSADDICNTSKLQWQFDAKGSMQLMDSSEIGIEVLSDSIKITPKVETELMKVNISNGTCSGLENPSQDESLTNEEIKTFISGILS